MKKPAKKKPARRRVPAFVDDIANALGQMTEALDVVAPIITQGARAVRTLVGHFRPVPPPPPAQDPRWRAAQDGLGAVTDGVRAAHDEIGLLRAENEALRASLRESGIPVPDPAPRPYECPPGGVCDPAGPLPPRAVQEATHSTVEAAKELGAAPDPAVPAGTTVWDARDREAAARGEPVPPPPVSSAPGSYGDHAQHDESGVNQKALAALRKRGKKKGRKG